MKDSNQSVLNLYLFEGMSCLSKSTVHNLTRQSAFSLFIITIGLNGHNYCFCPLDLIEVKPTRSPLERHLICCIFSHLSVVNKALDSSVHPPSTSNPPSWQEHLLLRSWVGDLLSNALTSREGEHFLRAIAKDQYKPICTYGLYRAPQKNGLWVAGTYPTARTWYRAT